MRTDDLFLAAFALSRGGELAGIDVASVNGRRVAFFRIEGPGLVEAEREYFHGPAVVHLQLLKAAVRRLKDAAFDAIREEERRSHASLEGQSRTDRRHQVAGGPGRDRR
jgi:hypothetical protein